MAAAPIHVGWLSPSLAGRVARATGRVIRDSEQTGEIVVAEEITAQAQLAYWVRSGIFERGEGRALLRDRAEMAETDLDTLRALPQHSLGREFARFLDREGIRLEGLAQPTPYTRGEEEAYLMRRMRQSHDLWHVLLGLGTQGHQEVLVHCFSVAQTGLPFSLGIIVMGAIKHMVLEGRWRVLTQDTRRAYRSGCNAAPILAAYWERRWAQPLREVREEFGIVPLGHPAPVGAAAEPGIA